MIRRPGRAALASSVLLFLLQVPPIQDTARAIAAQQAMASFLPTLSPAVAQALSGPATDHVIVTLRDQYPATSSSLRSERIPASRAALLRELNAVGAKSLHSYRVVNAVSATISIAEEARLRGDPAVLSVAADRVIRLLAPAPIGHIPVPGIGSNDASSQASDPLTPACTTSRTPSLEPEALQLTDTAFSNPSVAQAQRLRSGTGALINGQGVKVAYIADGVDVHNPDFIRNGKSVFVDYQDFSGDGPNAPTGGGEAFLDASSVAAQGHQVYDVNAWLVNKLAKPCPIRILGMAPGAELVGLKVFGRTDATTESAFVQAIDYAVSVDKVDVLNESFGGNPYPDLANDPISMANSNAVSAGVTVTVSSGDAGAASTIGSPGTDPGVIAVGASTQFRAYTEAGNDGITLGTGYVDNNISSLSSGGFAQTGPRTVDVVAPGDLGWALCTATLKGPSRYSDCTNANQKKSSPIQLSGGTSEAAPLTAGEAALVIQAYRSTHHHASPTPDLVKQIIMSTATDLGISATQQGAGLIDSYRAVQAALSYRDSVATPSPRAGRLLVNDTTAFTATDKPNTTERLAFDIRNAGSQAQRIAPKLLALDKTVFHADYGLHLDPLSDPLTFVNQDGTDRAFVAQTFKVPPGVQRLNASIAWLALQESSSVVVLNLFDPSGRLTAVSDPQNAAPGTSSGFGQVDVRTPRAGMWTALIWTRARAVSTSYYGAVLLSVSGFRYASAGTVTPAEVTLPAGHTATFTAITRLPGSPGDRVEEIVFPSPSGSTTLMGAIPVTERALVPLTRSGGSFSGTITGGNGRGGSPGQTLSYQFDLPAGLHNLGLGLRVADPNNNLEAVLVDPTGQPVDVQTTAGAIGNSGLPTYYTGAMQFFRLNPMAGRWLFVLFVNDAVGALATAQPFEAVIAFTGVRMLTRGIPDNVHTLLRAGKAVNAAILVENTGVTAKDVFLDPRLAGTARVPLQAPDSFSLTLPITGSQLPAFIIPPEVSSVTFNAQSPTPMAFAVTPFSGTPPFGGTGSPDIYQSSGPSIDRATGDYVASLTVQAPELASGAWQAEPEQVGPFGNGGVGPSTFDVSATAIGQPFDRQVTTTTTDDIWSPFATRFRTVVIGPLHIRELDLRITPAGPPGHVVRGYIYLDTFNPNSISGDELAAIPYAYTIGR